MVEVGRGRRSDFPQVLGVKLTNEEGRCLGAMGGISSVGGLLAPHLGPVRWPPPGYDLVLPMLQPQPLGKRTNFCFLLRPWQSGEEKSLERLSSEQDPPQCSEGAGKEPLLPLVLCLGLVPMSPTC